MAGTGVLLIGHGTRSAAGIRCVERLCELVADRLPGFVVSYCFLELHDRDIGRILEELIGQGVSQVATVPLLLFAAGHAKSDIPRECLAAASGRVQLVQADAFGCHPALVALSQQRYLDAVGQLPAIESGETCLLLVGRGSHDAQATAEMHRFAELRRQQLPGVDVEVAFIAMASPAIAEAIGGIREKGYRRVVVQPHLLFPGELFDQLGQLVQKQRAGATACEWHLVPVLAGDLGEGGPADQLLVDVVSDRAGTAAQQLSLD